MSAKLSKLFTYLSFNPIINKHQQKHHHRHTITHRAAQQQLSSTTDLFWAIACRFEPELLDAVGGAEPATGVSVTAYTYTYVHMTIQTNNTWLKYNLFANRVHGKSPNDSKTRTLVYPTNVLIFSQA